MIQILLKFSFFILTLSPILFVVAKPPETHPLIEAIESLISSINSSDIKYRFTRLSEPLAHLHIDDVLFPPGITKKSLAEFINFLFLNTNFWLLKTPYLDYPIILKSNLYNYFNNLTEPNQKDFLQLLAQEMRETIDLGPEFSKLLENEIHSPTGDLYVYLKIYEIIMSSYHSEAIVEGYLKESNYTPIFMMQLKSENLDPILSLLKEEASESNLTRLSKMLAFIFLHTKVLDSRHKEDHGIFENFLKEDLLTYIGSLNEDLKKLFYESFISSLSEDPFFSRNMSEYLKTLYCDYDMDKNFMLNSAMHFIRKIIKNSQHNILTGDKVSIPDLVEYFCN